MIKKFIQFILITSIVSGCATKGNFVPAPKISEDKSRLYIYRPWNFVAGGQSPTIHINDIEAFKIKNGGYIWFDLKPGEYVIEIKKPNNPFFNYDFSSKANVKMEAGKTYYIRWSPVISDMQPAFYYVGFSGNMFTMKEDIAYSEIQECSLIKTKNPL